MMDVSECGQGGNVIRRWQCEKIGPYGLTSIALTGVPYGLGEQTIIIAAPVNGAFIVVRDLPENES